MTNAEVLDIMRSALVMAVKLSGPMLLLSMAVGVLISVLQAATQIHEQTLTFVPKLIVIGVVCLITGSWMLTSLQEFTFDIFTMMLR
ncbi:flagellar biosynthesis protein FliQ [Anaerotignum faecicola]|nr:flagellar biosynthesis protein FliQ [Anaerotignum faecicola]